jgi:non-canonical (house-cleaning) NTP pyrophosphatase
MKVLLGTLSEQKISIAKSVLNDSNFYIQPVAVQSGIVEQPLNEESTIHGAINRAKNARASDIANSADAYLGLEAGLVKHGGIFYLLCVAALIDSKGNTFLGFSRKTPLPRQVSEAVATDNFDFGKSIRDFEKTLPNDPSDEIRNIVLELINRTQSFSEAISSAHLQYRLSSYFQ